MASSIMNILGFLALLCILPSAYAAKAAAVFGFGDSTMDVGNNNYLPKAKARADYLPYGLSYKLKNGRFSNGLIIPDFMARFLNMSGVAQPSLKPGVTSKYGLVFASGGSGVLDTTSAAAQAIPLNQQLDSFGNYAAAKKLSKTVLSDSLFLLSSGSSDYLSFLEHPKPTAPPALVAPIVDGLVAAVQRLSTLGARKIVVFGVPPLGCLPAVMDAAKSYTKCVGTPNTIAQAHNSALNAGLTKLRPTLAKGTRVVYADLFKPTYSSVQHPTDISYGFVKGVGACCGFGGPLKAKILCGKRLHFWLGTQKKIINSTTCSRPNLSVFWDRYHGSQSLNRVVSLAVWNGNASYANPINVKTLANL